MSKKKISKSVWLIVVLLLAAAVAAGIGWRYMSPTRIALVNYPEYVIAPLLEGEPDFFVRPEVMKWTETSGPELKKFDAIYFFGMGLKFTPRQEVLLKELAAAKVPLYVTASTRVETGLDTLTEEQSALVAAYLDGGDRENFQRLLDYTRYELDGKRLFAAAPLPPIPPKRVAYFHRDEEDGFEDWASFREYYRQLPGYAAENPVVLLFAGNGGALSGLIEALEKRHITVVATPGMWNAALKINEVEPDLVIYFPHGRLTGSTPDEVVKLLAERNIPLFCPIKVNQLYEEYLTDQRGMTGGMMSQSITMPELDGAAVPFVLSALFRNERGLQEYRLIPDRVERFADLVRKTLTLQRKDNADKKIAIVYYKGPGQNALEAGGLEVGDSLLNTLRKLQAAGYTTGELPEKAADLLRKIQDNAAIFGTYAEGAMEKFLASAELELIAPETYLQWVKQAIPEDLYRSVEEKFGPAPGNYFNFRRDNQNYLALGVVRFGNIVLLPQMMPGTGDDSEKLVHGVKAPPPHSYLATYLWIRYGFQADALLHFGTHGSLEFTPWKNVALSSHDWPDVLIGEMPHYYLYVINNIGEALVAKRRSYATMVSHLTAPFMNAGLYGELHALDELLHNREMAENPLLKEEYAHSIVAKVKEQKIDDELPLSEEFKQGVLTGEDERRLHNYLHELEHSKVNRGLYVIGRPYSGAEAAETAVLMSVDHVADVRFQADVAAGKAAKEARDDMVWYEKEYLTPAREALEQALREPAAAVAAGMTAPQKKLPDTPGNSYRQAVLTGVEARQALLQSTEAELAALVNAFNGGYLAPSPGGDPVGNPSTVPTGRNLYGVDPERTPTRESYAVGRLLGEALLAEKRKATGEYPKKVAFTLWGGEFIRSSGTNIGEIFFLLGVEPVWDSRGRVLDVRLIPLEELKRPRIDVVVQTSGQFRSAASSRMSLIDKAVRLAAADPAGEYGNYVSEGSEAALKAMLAGGLPPQQAKELADARIFGGVDGNFGTGVMGMVEAGDRWEDSAAIADRYLNNMGALYTDGHWGEQVPGVFAAQLTNTDTVVQPRSSNSYGPLSLDHVYEFMGGMNLAVKNVTGREPDAYFNDLRTPGRAVIQEAGRAAMAEARTTLLNPKFIIEMMEEGPSAAGSFAEAFRNTYGWEVMKPDMIKDHLWEEYKHVYIDDALQLNMRAYFEAKNPYALQEMTAVMLETVRKGLWNADAETIREIAELHVELVRDHGAGCSGFVCDNAKLREMIEQQLVDPALLENYRSTLDAIRNRGTAAEAQEEVRGLKLKEQKHETMETVERLLKDNCVVFCFIGAAILISLFALLRKRKGDEHE